MNREEYFSTSVSRSDYRRTRFIAPFQHRTAFNTGDIVPLMAEPILPGDAIKADLSYLVRMFTPLQQFFSNVYLDFYSFFVPYRLVWTHWQQFLGENDTTAWTQTTEYTIPQGEFAGTFYEAQTGFTPENARMVEKTFGNYLNINFTAIQRRQDGTFNGSATVSDLFRRSYILIWDNWFRDENVVDPILFSVGDTPESNPTFDYDSDLLKSAKMHDYFTSCLPSPMKGTPPTIGDDLDVVVGDDHGVTSGKFLHLRAAETDGGYSVGDIVPGNLLLSPSGNAVATGTASGSGIALAPSNLVARMGITIEDIRNAAVVTHVLERLALAGSRYPEFLKGIWGVTSSDARLQIPEYLSGKRFPIRVSEVVSTTDTSSSEGLNLGATGAMVKDGRGSHLFSAAFTEYGQLWILATVRVEQTYFQGLARKFTDKSFFDFPLPQTQHIGMQPRMTREIYSEAAADSVFGYGPAWDHYRHFPYQATSIMKPSSPLGLAHWDASEVYSSAPTLNKTFIEQQVTGIDRVIAVPSDTRGAFQWFGEFKINLDMTRLISADSEPGLMRI